MKNLPQHLESLGEVADTLIGKDEEESNSQDQPPIVETPAITSGDLLTTEGVDNIGRDPIEQEVLDDPDYQNITNEIDFQKEVNRRKEYRAKKLEPQNIPGTPLVPAKLTGELEEQTTQLTEKLFNTILTISEHPNGDQYADMLISNINEEKNDFGDGELYENVKVTDLLAPLSLVYPDLDNIEDPTNNTPRLVSPVAEKLKEFLKHRKNREDEPILYGLKDAASITGQSFKEAFVDAPQQLGNRLIETLSGFAEWGIGDVVKSYYMIDGLPEKEAEKRKKEFFELTGYFWQPDRPETLLGQLTLSGGEFGLAYFTGKAIYSQVAAPMKQIIPKIAEMIATPGGQMAFKEVTGGTLIGSKDERLATVLDMLGVAGEGPHGNWIKYIAGSEDDGIFEDRFKQFLDSMYTGVALATIAPLLMMTGKAGFHATKGTAKEAHKILKHGASFADRLFHNYPVDDALRMDLGGSTHIKTEQVKRVLAEAEEALLKQATVDKTKNIIKRGANKLADLIPGFKSSKQDNAGFIYEVPDVKPITKERLPSEAFLKEDEVVLGNISSKKVAEKFKLNRELPDNTLVEVRPTIAKADALNTKDGKQVLVTIHNPSKSQSGTAKQGVIGYDNAVTLRNVEFKVNQDSRLKISSGEKPKHPAMAGSGEIIQTKPVFEGIEVNFNPREDHLFRVVENGLAIRSAEEAVFFDKRVLVRGKVTYWDAASAPKPKGGKETSTKFKYETKQTVKNQDPFNEDETVAQILKEKGYEIGDESIQPIVKHKNITPFLQPVEGMSIDEIVRDSIKSLAKPIHYKKILAGQKKYFPSLFNLKNITDENRKQAIAEVADLFQKGWDNQLKSHPEIVMDAATIRSELEFMLGDKLDVYFREYAGTTDATAGTMLALRQYVIEESIPFRVSSSAVATAAKKVLDEGGKIPKKLLVSYYIDTIRLLNVLGPEVRLKGNIARSLESLKQAIGGKDELADNILAGAKDGSLEGEDLLIHIAQTVDKYTDHTQLLNGARPKGKLYHQFEFIKNWAVAGLLSGVKTLSAGPIGFTTYVGFRSGELYTAAAINKTGKLLYNATSKIDPKTGKRVETNRISKWIRKSLGTGKGVTKAQADAYQFGIYQALLEVLGGTGHFEKSAVAEGWRVLKSLDLGDSSSKHEMLKMFEGSTEVITLPVVGDFVLAKGVNAKALEGMLGLTEQGLQGHAAPFLKFLANSAGFINSANARIIMAQDGFMRTIIERAEMHMNAMARAESRLRSKISVKLPEGRELGEKELWDEYFGEVRNFRKSPDLIEKGKQAAKVAVMQDRKKGGYISMIENFKNTTSDRPGDFGLNVLKSYTASKLSFIRTMSNIYKQTLTERGMIKLAKGLGLSRKESRLFQSDETYRQLALAQTGSGLMVLTAGIGAATHWLTNENIEVSMEGIGSKPTRRAGDTYISMSEGAGFGPQIIIRDMNTGQKTFLPIERLDMGKAPLVFGAIMGSTYKQFLEANAKVKDEEWAAEGMRETDEIWIKFARALGDFMMDMPTAKGVRDSVHNIIPGMGHNWDPGKEAADFWGWIRPDVSGLSSLRATIKSAGQEYRHLKREAVENEMIEFEGGWEKQKYETKGGTEFYSDTADVPRIGKKIRYLKNLWHQMQDVATRTSILDIRNAENPIIGQELYAMVDPEGNLMRYLPDPTISDLQRAMSTLVLPFYPHVQSTTNTTELIVNFGVEYDHPDDWNTYNNYELSPEQKYHWTVLAGRYNKESFSDPFWKEELLKERLGHYDQTDVDSREEKIGIINEIKEIIDENRLSALEDMLSLERNSTAQDYFDASESQIPPLHAKDKL